MLVRSLESFIKVALGISPIVLISGARQVGKSTLAKSIYKNYIVLDDVAIRISAIENPNGFIGTLEKPICIDEIQKAPNLLESIKLYVDHNRNNGDFMLTGSANIFDLKETKDTLAGRIIELNLLPLSTKEINKKPHENCIDKLFVNNFEVSNKHVNLKETIINGGFPEILRLKSSLEKRLWFSSYISTYIERDAREIGDLRDVYNFFKFVNVLAPRSATLVNVANIASDIDIKNNTIDNYINILQQIFQIKLIQPYFENFGKRFVKSPKLFLTDTGIMSHLLKISTNKELDNSNYKGQIYETFIFQELLKHIGFSTKETEIYHYRTSDKKEIDFILTQGDSIIAIEVKASQTVGLNDFKHIVDFQKKSKKKIKGIVFYTGNIILDFSKDNQERFAIPFNFFF
jgi:predicted AAA+ superfamily ATPase